MLTDIETPWPTPEKITVIAERAGVPEKYLEQYGNYKAKVDYNLLTDEAHTPGKLVLVTAINPTPAGRRQNDHYGWFGRRHASHWQKHSGRAARAVARPRIRH